MIGNIEYRFLLNNIRNLHGRTPKDIYLWYHARIAEKQAKQMAELKVVFDALDSQRRSLAVNTEDANEFEKRMFAIRQLDDLESIIRKNAFSNESQFLEALSTVLSYKYA